MRLESANRLQTVRLELQARELKEKQYDSVVRDLAELDEELRHMAAGAGAAPGGQEDLAALISGLKLWQQHRGERLREFESRRRRWDRLEMLLAGRPLEGLEADARDARSKADTLVALVAPDDVATAAEWVLGSNGQAQHEAVRAEEREARETLATLAERLRLRGASMRDVPAAREECASADAELGRLRDLAEVIRLTRRFMESAVDRAHRTIAPVLQSALSDRLAAVTHGRYVEALVDPETLAVQVRGDGRSWRSASALSHGTAEQVYLLLRVALAEHLVRAGESTPFVFDDATVQSDNVRTLAIMETLLSLTPAHQVIVFSQETEVAEWEIGRASCRERV
jgi:DNA repair exonuclease SbcCD ATPase subunit